jgi:hypothetical protein
LSGGEMESLKFEWGCHQKATALRAALGRRGAGAPVE